MIKLGFFGSCVTGPRPNGFTSHPAPSGAGKVGAKQPIDPCPHSPTFLAIAYPLPVVEGIL